MDTQTEIAAKEFAVRAIDALGGTAEVARLCEVSPAAASQWKENGIPKPRLMFLRLARPDVFRQLEGNSPPEASRLLAP